MSTPRPTASPSLLAAIASGVPSRLVRKLDQQPRLAEGWSWEWKPDGSTVVTTDGGERVLLQTVSGLVSGPGQVTCSCLLSPRCLHRLAVVAALSIAEETAPASTEGRGERPGAPQAMSTSAPAVSLTPPSSAEPTAPIVPVPAQRTAAVEAWRALTALLSSGALGAGAVLQGEILRALHTCRAAGLPRLSSSLLSTVRSVRDCRSESAGFELGPFAAVLADALACARAVGGVGVQDAAVWIGTTRREYTEVGNLHLHGLFSEPILTTSGYAGVLTYLLDGKGNLFTLADVSLGGVDGVARAYSGSARLGGGAVTHRELGRRGLFVQGATVSAEGRLGTGHGVQAVKAGPTAWTDPVLAARFAQPLDEQVARGLEALEVSASERRAGTTLIFFDAVVVGTANDALLLKVGRNGARPTVVDAIAADPGTDLPYRDNLCLLARCGGLLLRCVGRLELDRPRAIKLLAVGPTAESTGLALPAEWGGRCNLGLDRLQGAYLPAAGEAPQVPELSSRATDVLISLQRRLERLALGGRGTIFPGVVEAAEREARQLEAALMPGGTALLHALIKAALDESSERSARLGAAFVAGSEYCKTARLELLRSAWRT